MIDILYMIFVYPLEIGMKFIFYEAYRISENYGISIIFMSLIVNLFLIPIYYLAEISQSSERIIKNKMKSELDKINKAFKGEAKYFYIKSIYKRYKYNPIMALRASFGFLIQVPVFFSAYHFLSNISELEGERFLIFKDLSAPDRIINTPYFSINILPLVMTFISIISSYIYAKNLNINEKIQLWLLALFFFIILYKSPSALVFYWTLNNLFSLCKNYVSVYVIKLKHLN